MEDRLATPRLVALCAGFGSSAEPLVCDDLRGRGTLLGDMERLPRVLGSWQNSMDKGCLSEREQEQFLRSVTMWEKGHAGPETFSVVAPTFLVGRCASTFEIAWQLVAKNLLRPWGGVIASAQTSGRGQLQRPWYSPRGNLYVSFILPDHPLFAGGKASVILGHLLVQACKACGYTVQLKWPNDILNTAGQKVAGLLLEERHGVLMAGLGVNLRDIPSPAELRAESQTPAGILLRDDGQDRHTPPFFVWQELQANMARIFAEDFSLKNAGDLLQEASLNLAFKGRRVALDECTEGMCLGVGQEGGVLLLLSNGLKEEFCSGSLRVL